MIIVILYDIGCRHMVELTKHSKKYIYIFTFCELFVIIIMLFYNIIMGLV